MKRRSFIREIVLLSAAPMLVVPRKSLAQLTPAFVGASRKVAAAGGGGSCPDDSSPSASNDGATATNTWGAGRLWIGQSQWTDGGTPRTICKLGFKITGVAGASSSTFVAAIFANSASPTYNFDTPAVATSDGVTGVDAWSSTWVYFTFPTPYTTTASKQYVLAVAPTVARASNDMTCYMDNTAMAGYRDFFSGAGAADQASGNDLAIKIFWQ